MLKQLIYSLSAPSGKKQTSTYHLILLQSKSNRIVKTLTSSALKKYKLSYVDWALLGLLFEGQELCYGSLAEELGVEPSFVSVLVEGLQKKGYIRQKKNASDKRVKFVALTKKGQSLIPNVEESLRKTLDSVFGSISASDLARFTHVMELISRLDKEQIDEVVETL